MLRRVSCSRSTNEFGARFSHWGVAPRPATEFLLPLLLPRAEIRGVGWDLSTHTEHWPPWLRPPPRARRRFFLGGSVDRRITVRRLRNQLLGDQLQALARSDGITVLRPADDQQPAIVVLTFDLFERLVMGSDESF
jgi:hypothetical protein